MARQGSALSLEAALRDCRAAKPEDRTSAVESLASAYLTSLDENWPDHGHGRHLACESNSDGERVREALLGRAQEDDDARVRGRALLSLGLLGEPRLLDLDPRHATFEPESADPGWEFVLESWVLGLSQFAANLRRARESVSTTGNKPEISSLTQTLEQLLPTLLTDDEPAMAHAACSLAAELADAGAYTELTRFLKLQTGPDADDELALSAVVALSRFEHHSSTVLDQAASLIHHADWELRFEALNLLAAARDVRAVPACIDALEAPQTRDGALEALAIFGDSVPDNAVRRIAELGRYLFWPSLTNVRALYAEAKLRPTSSARSRLTRIRRSWRPLMRDAAGQALELLDVPPTGS